MNAPGSSLDKVRPLHIGGTPLTKSKIDGVHDSGCISPPTQVKVEMDTPCHYFLRGQAKWSSTPLPISASHTTPFLKSSSSPNLISAKNSTPNNIVIDFKKRLENCDICLQEDEFVSNEPDSGFESLINSTAETESSEGEGNSINTEKSFSGRKQIYGDSTAPIIHDCVNEISTLGAIPKRRSPRQVALANKVDGIERLARIKSSGRNLGAINDSEIDHEEERFSIPDLVKYNKKKSLLQKSVFVSKEGRETCDFLRHFYERNISGVLCNIFQYLPPDDLCRVAQVSQLWNLALNFVKFHDNRRANFVAVMRVNRENAGHSFVKLRSKLSSPRRVMQEVANITSYSPSSGKRDRNPSCSTIVSPSKIRHKLFVDEAKKLNPGERLVHCPLCTSPSRVSVSISSNVTSATSNTNIHKALCSSPKCKFEFCPDCQCEEHAGRSCRVTRTGSSKVPRSGAVTSKKSKARLRRL